VNDRPPVAVVFATLNHARTLPAVLQAIDRTAWPDLEIIVVDCGSVDATRGLLAARAARTDGVRLRWLDRAGSGRATALAAAMQAAGERDVVRLHADVVPEGADWLAQLFAVHAEHPDAGIVGGKIVFPTGRIQSCGRRLINGLGIADGWSDLRWLEADVDEPVAANEVDGVTGELCLLRRAMLTATGGLDTNFDPLFGDDDDLCLRARWHGFAVFVAPAVRAVHFSPRPTPMTREIAHEPTGTWQRQQDERRELRRCHRDYWQQKWGFDPEAPDLHAIRRRYGHTRICWRIGERLSPPLPAEPAVDVCVVTWNSRAVLPRFFDHLAATDWPELRVFVTDNGSSDDTVAYLRERAATLPFPLHIEAMPQNLGVAQALNLAFRRGQAPIVARLDDDAFVPPNWLRGLVPNFHRRPWAGVVGPRLLHANAGEGLQNGPSRHWPAPFPGIGPGAAAAVTGRVRVHALCGCCNLYRRSVFAHAGYLDVRFAPSQFDETDHHVALHVAGYEAIYDGSVTVWHQRNAGRGETAAAVGNFAGNRVKHDTKWGGRQWAAIDRAIDLSIDGRFLPSDDASVARHHPPPVPAGPPMPPPRAAAELRSNLAIARRHSLLRLPDSPLAPWWRNQIAVAREALASDDAIAPAALTRLGALLPHDVDALLLLASASEREGDHALAATLHERAGWLATGSFQAPGRVRRPMVEPAVLLPRPPEHVARVLLLPPLAGDDDSVELAVATTAAALLAVGVPFRRERQLVPTPGSAEVVHAFGAADLTTLLPRLMAMRAARPDCRIIWSPLAVDPGPGQWCERELGKQSFLPAAVLRQLHAEALRDTAARQRAIGVEPTWLAYWQRCLELVDVVAVATPAERQWFRALAPQHAQVLVDPGLLEVGPEPSRERHGAVAIGLRGAKNHVLTAALAIAASDLVLSWRGRQGWPFADWYLQQLAGPGLRLLPALEPDQLPAALLAARTLLWLPAAPDSFAVPLAAAAAGCHLVLTRGVGAEALFGRNAHYVDPCDIASVRNALRAAQDLPNDHAAAWRRAVRAANLPTAAAARWLAVYGLGDAQGNCIGSGFYADRNAGRGPAFA
jgi:GT2 family glycosyltransferase